MSTTYTNRTKPSTTYTDRTKPTVDETAYSIGQPIAAGFFQFLTYASSDSSRTYTPRTKPTTTYTNRTQP